MAAAFETHGQHAAGVFHIDIQVAVVEYVFQVLLGRIDQVVEAGFGQTHVLTFGCWRKRGTIRAGAGDCKDYLTSHRPRRAARRAPIA
ncbi:hypothetical protein [Pseudomonas sp. KNUC1026]|uniref:hypothetical protein n=1 Tax=Pseudomonas sp. KNUC1026 TaxID=2893890 RepID=UPI001F3D77B4|nr:hypothetical protein [Pseudomonas sp. KNUC1026]UFH51803.1 hypothetical protein LN139_20680 [Pseudomonas sp. KNUC1026]